MNLVGTSTAANAWVTGAQYQRYSFFAVGRYWCFYSNGVNIGWKSSIDGILWSAFTAIRGGIQGYLFSVAFDGVNLHYVYAEAFTWGADLFYRMGLANADGTITWLAAEQTVLAVDANHIIGDPSIEIDSNGYPWIGYGYGQNAGAAWDTYAYVAKSKTKNGTWTHENILFISPYRFSASRFNVGMHPSCWCSVVALTSGKMYAIVGTDGDVATVGAEKHTKGNLWTGAAWGGEETCVASDHIVSGGGSPVSYGDDVHFIHAIWNPFNTNNDTYYVKRTYGVGWGAPVLVRAEVATLMMAVLSVNNAGILYCFWLNEPVVKHGYYKKCVGGVWDAGPTDWFTETDDFAYSGLIPVVSNKSYNGQIIFSTPTLLASPYNHKMLTLAVDSPVTVVKQVVASLDDAVAYQDTGVWAIFTAIVQQQAGYWNAQYNHEGGGMRFTGITIPAGVTITKAYLDFVCPAVYGVGGVVNSVIIGEKTNAAAQFSNIADYKARRGTIVGGADNTHITAASVLWNNIGAWVATGIYRSPDISSIIQELVNFYGGLAAANIVLFWDDHGDNSQHADFSIRCATSYDGTPANAPVLYIEYTTAGGGSRAAPLAPKLVAAGVI